MQESTSKQSVSRSHAANNQTDAGLTGSSGIIAATQKKSQIKKALGDFNEHEEKSRSQKKSILSDEGAVLHVGKEKQGTIIKDTKHKRWSFTNAIKDSMGGWFKNEKSRVEKTFRAPIPEKIVEASSTRTDVIKKAAKMSALAGTDSYKKEQTKKPVPKAAHSSIKIKPKDVPKEIGDTKPRWTHVIEDEEPKEEIVSHTQKDSASITKTKNSKLLDPPEKKLLLPEHAGVVKTETIKKEYRSPRVVHKVSLVQPFKKTSEAKSEETPKTAPKAVEEKEVAELVPEKQEPEPVSVDIDSEETKGPITPPKEPEVKPVRHTQTTANVPHLLEGKPGIPTSTIVLVIVFITVITVSTFAWNVLDSKRSENNSLAIGGEAPGLVVADSELKIELKSSSFTTDFESALNNNTGFTKFILYDSTAAVSVISNWGEWFARGTMAVELGGFGNKPFIIIKSDSKEIALASMLSLENNLPIELQDLYNSSTSTRFTSSKVGPNDIRILRDSQSVYMVYFVSNDGFTLIASSIGDVAALIDRVK